MAEKLANALADLTERLRIKECLTDEELQTLRTATAVIRTQKEEDG